MGTVFIQRANLRRYLMHMSPIPELRNFGAALDDALDTAGYRDPYSDEQGPLAGESFNSEGKEPAHFRYKGVVYSRDSTHRGNSVIAFGSARYGIIKVIKLLKSGQVVLTVKPYTSFLGDTTHFSRYAPHFPIELVSAKEGPQMEVPITDVMCHCARYRISKRAILLLKLMRVSFVMIRQRT
jgi:hypothetical protein